MKHNACSKCTKTNLVAGFDVTECRKTDNICNTMESYSMIEYNPSRTRCLGCLFDCFIQSICDKSQAIHINGFKLVSFLHC